MPPHHPASGTIPAMDRSAFAVTRRDSTLDERSAARVRIIDPCRLVGAPTQAGADRDAIPSDGLDRDPVVGEGPRPVVHERCLVIRVRRREGGHPDRDRVPLVFEEDVEVARHDIPQHDVTSHAVASPERPAIRSRAHDHARHRAKQTCRTGLAMSTCPPTAAHHGSASSHRAAPCAGSRHTGSRSRGDGLNRAGRPGPGPHPRRGNTARNPPVR